jgi:alpha-ribazole phosphatase
LILALVRHTAPDVAPGVCYGRTDVGLAASAAAEAARVAAALAHLDAPSVWTSPSRRCRWLAERLSAAPRVDARLAEMDFGDWEGRRWDDVPRRDLDGWAADLAGFAPPGGERAAAMAARVAAAFADIARGEAPVVIVTHAGPLKVLEALAEGLPVDLARPSLPFGAVRLVNRAACGRAISRRPETPDAARVMPRA